MFISPHHLYKKEIIMDVSKTKNSGIVDPSRFVSLFDSALSKSSLNAAEIARRVGLPSRQAIYQIRSGHMKLPLNRVPDVAKVLNTPMHTLFFYALEQYLPRETVQLLIDSVVNSLGISVNEKNIIDYIRIISANSDPELSTKMMDKLREAVK